MKPTAVLWLGLVAAALSACTLFWDPAKWNSEQTAKIRQRATFEMSCPNENLKVVELDRESDGTLKSLGVEGCGKKATYVHLRLYGDNAIWSMSSQQN